MPGYEVVTPRPVRKLIDDLAGKGAGYRVAYEQPTICGVHLKRGFRLAFTIQPPEKASAPTRVAILYIGQREPRHRDSDVWTVLHDLFGVENPPERHDRPPCCDGGLPNIGQDDLDAFLDALQRMTRGQRPVRRRARSRRRPRGVA